MNRLRLAVFLLLISSGILTGGCTQGNSGDDAAAGTAAVPLGLDRFLLFPNPIVETGGTFQTDTNTFAQAYYSAVDPDSERTTLAAWKSKNQFGTGGQEFVAVFRDVRDLGYGRRMAGRRNSDGSIAFFVENYNVAKVPGGYSHINVDAARVQDAQWHVNTNAIEWSPAQCKPSPIDPPNCASTVSFAKYFSFDPITGQRQGMLDFDGRGQKALPGVCTNCHGGRGDPLTPQPSYALVEDSQSRKRGDMEGRLQPFNLDSFEWSTTSGFTRADQEAILKIFNQWVLCTYPKPGGGTSPLATGGTCTRPTAGLNEWQGTAGKLIEDAYGGAPSMSNPQFSDAYAPTGWSGTTALYRQVVVPYCRTCHLLRGTANESGIDFDSEPKFRSYADRSKVHVFDRGNMPLAFLVYQDFWRSSAPSMLASYIDSVTTVGTATAAGGDAKRPGRPIADPGPDRMVRTGADAKLYGGDSLFATSYSWTLDPPAQTAVIGNPNGSTATFFSNIAGNYTVRLTVSNREQSDSKMVTITVDNTFRDPATLKFAHVKNVLQNGSPCTACHLPRAPPQPAITPAIWYTNVDRNKDGVTDATDDAWLYSEIMGRVNLTEISDSPLLRKATGNHHSNGVTLFRLATAAGLSNYSIIYNWILNGAQLGGVGANWIATITNPVTFSGGTFAIPLSGSTSIGAKSFSWSVVPNTIPPHPNGTPPVGVAPSITQADPLLPGATLNVFDAGTYDVTLLVTDGTDTDQKTATVDVQEAAVVANFTPHAGALGTNAPVAFNFPTNPSSASVTLNAITTGNPISCTWQVSPAGPILGSPFSCTSTSFTASTTQIGNLYTVTFTANNVSKQGAATKGLIVQAAVGSNPSGADFTFGSPKIQWTVRGDPANVESIVMSDNTLSGSASGLPTLAYAWSAASSAVGGASGCSATPSGQTSSISATSVGNCDVTLTVTNGFAPASAMTHTVAIGPLFTFAANVVPVISSASCATGGCHAAPLGMNAPSLVNDGGLYNRVAAVGTGRLLACPSTGCGGMVGGRSGFIFGDTSNYDILLTWIRSGTPDN